MVDTKFKKGQKPWNYGMKGAYSYPKGKKITPEAIKQRTETRLGKYGCYTPAESTRAGIQKRPESWYDNVVKSIQQRDISHKKNPFYGKHHSAETKKLISKKNSGSNNPGWAGGTSTLPYGIGFTRKFKRLIRERDGDKCQRCGKSRKQNQRTLEIHHIDHDKMNNNPTNLITVCHSCNVWLSYHRHDSPTCFPKRKMLLT